MHNLLVYQSENNVEIVCILAENAQLGITLHVLSEVMETQIC